MALENCSRLADWELRMLHPIMVVQLTKSILSQFFILTASPHEMLLLTLLNPDWFSTYFIILKKVFWRVFSLASLTVYSFSQLFLHWKYSNLTGQLSSLSTFPSRLLILSDFQIYHISSLLKSEPSATFLQFQIKTNSFTCSDCQIGQKSPPLHEILRGNAI